MKGLTRSFWAYLGRFSLVHVLTYLVAGLIFMNLQGYENAFEQMQAFSN